jgi:hypothetical protein
MLGKKLFEFINYAGTDLQTVNITRPSTLLLVPNTSTFGYMVTRNYGTTIQ